MVSVPFVLVGISLSSESVIAERQQECGKGMNTVDGVGKSSSLSAKVGIDGEKVRAGGSDTADAALQWFVWVLHLTETVFLLVKEALLDIKLGYIDRIFSVPWTEKTWEKTRVRGARTRVQVTKYSIATWGRVAFAQGKRDICIKQHQEQEEIIYLVHQGSRVINQNRWEVKLGSKSA